MSQYCTQCGTENVNDAKFCKSCGHSLIEKEPSPSSEPTVIHAEATQAQEVAVNAENTVSVENSTEVPTSLSGWLLLIPVIAWVLYKLGAMAGGNIGLMFGFMTVPNILAEALGGAIAIVGLPLIVTGLIYGVKKANGIQYTNFVKHTLIASIALLAFGIVANINTIRDEQKAVLEQTTSAVVDPSVPVAEEAPPAAEAAAPEAEEAAPVLSKTEKLEQDCNNGLASKCNDLGGDYYVGDGIQKDIAKALIFYKKSCDLGNAKGCGSSAALYHDIDMAKAKVYALKAISIYKKNCNLGDKSACNEVYNFYNFGTYIDRDESIMEKYASKTFVFNKKDCDKGDIEACVEIGQDYLQGRGVQQDIVKGENLLKKSCNNGSGQGCRQLGFAHYINNTLEKDYTKAAQYFKKACDIFGNNYGCAEYEELQSQGY